MRIVLLLVFTSLCSFISAEERKGISCPPMPTDFVGQADEEVQAQLHVLRALLYENNSWCVIYPERVSWSEGFENFAKPDEQVWEVKVTTEKFKIVKRVFFNPNTNRVMVRE